ncbi:hypothetical protein GM661_02815 [Iocasia frigidifontis]|uniref:Aminodeoxychorismate lyase n=1 Tax=Iocasia fonsfrigidae TaxID=2682810 RepID=A0A8A7K5D7_9FIRM|nr:endolytic transglycosylase MltG [Iocasia fonsfrigidae]QTL96983.1 hypothetical protein GM661_02815 [Iocasia fonsfrigidae]
MFKNGYLKEIIPDMILAAGIIILLAGVFSFTGFDYLLERGPQLKEENPVVEFDSRTADEIESAVLEQEQERDKKEVVKTREKIIDSALLLTIQNKPELLENYFSKDEFSASLAVESITGSVKDNKGKGDTINIFIPEGSSGLEVARIFEESNLMTYQDFKQLLLLFDIETRIKAGSYSFKNNSSVADILTKILIK